MQTKFTDPAGSCVPTVPVGSGGASPSKQALPLTRDYIDFRKDDIRDAAMWLGHLSDELNPVFSPDYEVSRGGLDAIHEELDEIGRAFHKIAFSYGGLCQRAGLITTQTVKSSFTDPIDDAVQRMKDALEQAVEHRLTDGAP